MSSRSRPLAPSEQKRFLSLEEITALECSLTTISEVIFAECPLFRKDPAAQPKSLATLVLQLQLFMDEVLGEKSHREDRFAVKIPAGFFRDFAHPNGVIKHILVWCLEFRHQQQCEGSTGRRFEVLSDKNREFAIALVQYIWQRLKEEGFWTPPHIFFEGDFDPVLLERLKDIVRRHSGVVVTDPEKATHRVVPQTVIDPEDTEFYFRAIEQRGSKYFVHWWYRPDSYDTWVMAALTSGMSGSSSGGNGGGAGAGTGSADGLLAPVIPPEGGQWTVSSEWLILLDQYNEWMNEGDFELNHSPLSDQQAERSEEIVLSEKTGKERSKKEQATFLSETSNTGTEISRHSSVRLSLHSQTTKDPQTIPSAKLPSEQGNTPAATHAYTRRKRSRASAPGSTSRTDPVNGHNDTSSEPHCLSSNGPDLAAFDSCVSEKLQGVPRYRLSGSGGREKKRSKLPDPVKSSDAETASAKGTSSLLESEDATAFSARRYTLQIKLDYLYGLGVSTEKHTLVKAMTAAAEALGASPSNALEALQLLTPPLSMDTEGTVLHSCTVVQKSPALRDALAAQGSQILESSSTSATVKDVPYLPLPVSNATHQQVLNALACLRKLDIPVSKSKKAASQETGLTCSTPSSLAVTTAGSSALPISGTLEPKKRKMSPFLMNGTTSSDAVSVPTTSPSKTSPVAVGSAPTGDLSVSLTSTVVPPQQSIDHQQRSAPDAPNGPASSNMSSRVSGFCGAPTANPPAFTEPQRMAPGVVQHPPRSLQSSVAVTPPKELFHLMRSLNPLDPNLSTNVLECLMKERDSLSQRLCSAERALRTIMVMWGSRMQPSNASFSFGRSREGASSELPDVPPVVPLIAQEAEIVDKTDNTKEAHKDGAHNVSLESGCVSDQAAQSFPPTWLTSTAQHLSDFERRHYEEETAAETAETIDMFEETGFRPGETSKNFAIFLPTTAQWFSFDTVHPIEEKQLGVFFYLPNQEHQSHHHQHSSTSLVREALKREYMTIRNAIIRRYRVNPFRYLTLVHCRQFVEGDAATLLKIHAFLDFWGLINFQALPHTFPTRTRRPMHFRSRPAMHKEQQSSSPLSFFHHSSLTFPSVPHQSSSARPLIQAEKAHEKKGISQESTDPVSPNNNSDAIKTKSSGVTHCVACSKLCLYAYYVLKAGNVTGVSTGLIHRSAWCLNCFANGRYPEVLTERSFVKVTIPLSVCDSEEKWTAAETEKLIEGIELYAEDWESVSRHVATRSPTECVSYFIRLPLEDPLSPTSSRAADFPRGDFSTTAPSQKNRTSESLCNRWAAFFDQTQNPLMAQLKFFCSILGPEVAEAAAVAACRSLLNQLERKKESNPMNMEQKSLQPTSILIGDPTSATCSEIGQTKECETDGNQLPLPTISGDTVAVRGVSLHNEAAAEPRQVSLNVKEDDTYLSNTEKDKTQPPTIDGSHYNKDLDDALSKPVTEAHMQEALQSAFKAAILAAERKAREEEGNICAILRALNNIKEQQLESKIAQFFACDTAIDMATDAVNKKLEDIYQLRDTLRSKIAEAMKENQSVLAEYQKERHQKQLQQQHTLQQQLQQKLQLQQQHLQRQLQQLHYQHQFQQNQQQQHHHQPPLQHALNGIPLQSNLGTLQDRFSDPKHFLMPHLSGLPTVGDSGIPFTPSVLNLPLGHVGNAGGLLQSFVSRAPPPAATPSHTKPMTDCAPTNAALLGAAPGASEPSATRASQPLPAQQLYWSMPR